MVGALWVKFPPQKQMLFHLLNSNCLGGKNSEEVRRNVLADSINECAVIQPFKS